jgi:hypothetical protein
MSARSFNINKLTKQSNIKVLNKLGFISVLLHDNCIFTIEDSKTIKLNSCGYRTNTTKTAMNRAFSQLNLSYSVKQVKGNWFVTTPDNTVIPFVDGMTINVK